DRAFADWRNTAPAQRQALLFKLADLVEANAAKFGELSARENGSPIMIATTMVGKVVEWIRYYAHTSVVMQKAGGTGSPRPRIRLMP
ncbi:MAG: aldehyde dehydrogenase family protein, partial [Mycobacterium sp.]